MDEGTRQHDGPEGLERTEEGDDASRDLLPQLIAQVYGDAPAPLRRNLLAALLRPLGPLALAAVATGAFGPLLHRRGWWLFEVSIEDAAQFSAGQIFELARYVEQAAPEVMAQVGSMIADSLGSGLLMLSGTLLLRAVRRRNLLGRGPG
jgi:hypothetical protein